MEHKSYMALVGIKTPNQSTTILCSFCQFAKWYKFQFPEVGCISCAECTNHVSKLRGLDVYAIDGGDCLEFKPIFELDVAADITGYWLRGEEINWNTVPWLID